jgi:hypothetical protein
MARVPPFGASGHRRAASDSSLFSTGYIELEEALSRGLRSVTSEPAGVTPLALPATPRAPRLLVEEPVPEGEEEEPLEVAQADMEAPGAEEGAVLAPLRQPSRQPVSSARRVLGMARAALVEDALSHKRLLASMMVPRAFLRGMLCLLAALMLIIPLVFNNALTGGTKLAYLPIPNRPTLLLGCQRPPTARVSPLLLPQTSCGGPLRGPAAI